MKPKWGAPALRLRQGESSDRWSDDDPLRAKHRGKPSKRVLAYFDADGIVRREALWP